MQAECATKQTRQLATKTCCMQQIIQIMQHNWIYSFLSERRRREREREGEREGDRGEGERQIEHWFHFPLDLSWSCSVWVARFAFQQILNATDEWAAWGTNWRQVACGMRQGLQAQTALSAAAFNCCPIRLVPANVSGMKQHLSQHESQQRKCCKRRQGQLSTGHRIHLRN